MADRRARVQADVVGAPPEQVLILETVGSVGEFVRAVQRIEGTDWLGETEDVFEPDEDFFLDEDHLDHEIGGRLFLVMSDQQALDQIISLWRRWLADPAGSFDYGLAPWKQVFAHLKDIRPWDSRDRIGGTGIVEDWRDRVAQGQEAVPVEIELWFRSSPEHRRNAEDRVRSLVEHSNGRVVTRAEIEEISYHAILAEVPAALIPSFVETEDARLVRADDVMFFRPTGQTMSPLPADDPLPALDIALPEPRRNEPIIALLDGLPLENHQLLAGRLTVDDPAGWATDYAAADRVHGTAMASLICHGDISGDEGATDRRLYVRPIMRPGARDFDGSRAECVPDDELFVDLLHRSIRRLFDGEGEQAEAAAPTVRVVNLSVCDRTVTLGRYPSPIARVLNWLSWRYSVLFVVSAGNYATALAFQSSAAALDGLSARELEALTLASILDQAPHRRLLAPSEAINALTIGAAHADAYPGDVPPTQRNLIDSPKLPSPINALGLGFRRTVKPDVLLAGGRQMYSDTAVGGGTASCSPVRTSGPPGQRAASPGTVAGELGATRFSRGTSNAAARASRQLAWLYDAVVLPMRERIGDLPEAVLLKALLVHAASWDEAVDRLTPILEADNDSRGQKSHCARLLGYGAVDEGRLGGGTASRVVLVGASTLADDLAHVYAIPLPPSLSGERVWRRVTITLAWSTPINPKHRNYRRGRLWFDAPKETLAVERVNAQWQTVRRGTLQHEVMEGERAAAFADGDTLDIRVNCKADAGELTDEIPYALAVTLEAAPMIDVSIYEEIEARVRRVLLLHRVREDQYAQARRSSVVDPAKVTIHR
jgi:hypothetical protein